VRMKVCVLGALLAIFVMSVAWNPDPGMQLASAVSFR